MKSLKYIVSKNGITIIGSRVYTFPSSHENFLTLKGMIDSGELKDEAQLQGLLSSKRVFKFDADCTFSIVNGSVTVSNKISEVRIDSLKFAEYLKKTLGSIPEDELRSSVIIIENIRNWFVRALSSEDTVLQEAYDFECRFEDEDDFVSKIDENGFAIMETVGDAKDLLARKLGKVLYEENEKNKLLENKECWKVVMVDRHDPARVYQNEMIDFYCEKEEDDLLLRLLYEFVERDDKTGQAVIQVADIGVIIERFKEECLVNDDAEERKAYVDRRVSVGLFANDAYLNEYLLKFEVVIDMLSFLQTTVYFASKI